MMKDYSLVFFLVVSSNFSDAQSLPMGTTGGSRFFLKPGAYAFVTELPPAPSETTGDYYVANDWFQGNIILNDSMRLEALFFKYNLKANHFEIKTEHEVKILPGKRVIYFDWSNNQNPADGEYQRADEYELNGTKLEGFIKIIQRGSYSLMMGLEFKIIPANFNTALNVGERNDKIVKEEVYYILREKKLLRVDSNKKKFTEELKKFTGYDLSQSVKLNKINPKELEDLLIIVEELNNQES
ncbi:MAG TPA: hypothetical protein VFW11_01380 [Cyclobacteriaceae bacterium]|nr:hypothetical protein [Cyclobacteriaceae bacterium]